jgi:VWFA-related protein
VRWRVAQAIVLIFAISTGSDRSGLALVGQQPATFGSATTAIVVDVVVRDKQGRPVTDLQKADFELLEDGVPQDIGDLTLVAPPSTDRRPTGSGAGAQTGPPGPAQKPPESISLMALVFDRLSPEGRALAHKAALAFADSMHSNDYCGVFLSDLSLVTVQPFTNDVAALKKGVDRVATRATSTFDRLRIGGGAYGDTNPGTATTASPESEGSAAMMIGDPGHTRTVEPDRRDGGKTLQSMLARMERSFEAMSRDEQGVTTVQSLLALVEGMALQPGRKTIIFFAEALAIPPAVQSRFESVVAAANRQNVAIYSVDAAGLRVHSGQTETAQRINSLGAESQGRDVDNPPGKLTESLEINEDTLRRDPAVSLRLLADRTGGFLIDNTNDLSRGLRTIDADRRFHYLLTYTPKNGAFHGEWRNLAVRVPNKPVQVRARSGYLAVSKSFPSAPKEEGDALAAALLERNAPAQEILIRSRVLTFPQAAGPSRVPIAVEIPAAMLTFRTDSDAYHTDFTVFARVVDQNGQVVRSSSQAYRLTGPANNAAAAGGGNILFYRQPLLEPGTYRLEVAVFDAMNGHGGVDRQDFTVNPSDGTLKVSSLVVVRRVERVAAAERDASNPLFVEDAILYPNMGEGISRKGGSALLYLAVAGASDTGTTAELTVLQDGAPVSSIPLTLPSPSKGWIRQVWQTPIDGLSPGTYTFRVTLRDGRSSAIREHRVEVIE